MLINLPKPIAIALAVCIALGFGSVVWWSSAHQPERAKYESHPQKAVQISPDERIANYTGWLAVLTAALVGGALIQGYFLLRADNTARISADAARRAVQMASAEYVASHRPKLRIRNIVVDPPKSENGQIWPLLHPGHLVCGQLFIANVGGNRADILDGHCLVFWNKGGLPMRPPYEGGGDNLRALRRTLLSGESTPVAFQSNQPMDGGGPTIGRDVIGGTNLYVMGWVTYADKNNDVRQTCFCREFRLIDKDKRMLGADGRFLPVDNLDYEHEE